MLAERIGSLAFVWYGDRIKIIPLWKHEHPSPMPNNNLTPAELKLLPHLVEGMTDKEIGSALGCSSHVVHFHLGNIMRKLGMRTRVSVAVHCVREGIVP